MPQMLARLFFLVMATGLALAQAYFTAGLLFLIWVSLMAYEYGFLFQDRP